MAHELEDIQQPLFEGLYFVIQVMLALAFRVGFVHCVFSRPDCHAGLLNGVMVVSLVLLSGGLL